MHQITQINQYGKMISNHFLYQACILFVLIWIPNLVLGTSCNVDPVHDLQTSLSGNLAVPNFGYQDTTEILGTEACRNSIFNYPPGLSMTTDVFTNHVDSTVPWETYIMKQSNTSFLKIEINAAFVCSASEVASCQWEIVLNDKYRCDPPAFHQIYNTPTDGFTFRSSFTAICKKWTYGGSSDIPAGYIKVGLVESSLNSFDGPKWQDPLGTLPHGTIPILYKGTPTIGDGYYSSFFVEEVEENPYRAFFHDRAVHSTTTAARVFTFTKNEGASATALKITVYDNFRCHTREDVNFGQPTKDTCTFELRIDGASCSPGSLRTSILQNDHSDLMHGITFVGVCTGISAGAHTISLSVSGTGEPYLGMLSTTGTIYVEEIASSLVGSRVFPFLSQCSHTPDPALSTPLCFPSVEPNRDCILNCRTTTFIKPSSTSITKVQIYDNLSCSANYGNGATCDLEVRIDRMSCTDPGPMKFNHIDDSSHAYYRSGVGYVGYCRLWNGQPLSAGSHTLRLFRTILSQNPSATSCATCPTSPHPSIGEGVTGYMEISFYEPETETRCVECTCGGHGTCQLDGTCVCDIGFTGNNCTTCDVGYEGANCDQCISGNYYHDGSGCVYCDCSGNGACDATGVCQCNIGYTGTSCESCATGYEGVSCFQCSSGYLREGRTCVSACSSGFIRQNDICVSECHYGYYANGGTCTPCGCSSTGSYSVGCDSDGQCACKSGFSGLDCSVSS